MAKKSKNTPKKKFIQCSVLVNKDSIKRESVDGVEHITITSFTLPDNIVMNGGLYPANEIDSSFETLERTLAPVEHPMNNAGQFISASDPEAIHNFHAGAFNSNVSKNEGRIKIDKVINVQEALKTERGKRLLDRINELETSKTPRPIHTSVGVFLSPEMLDEPQTNDDGLEFTWIAREMVFDHDAILLDSVAAAQPHQGVGIGINADGQEFEVEAFSLDANIEGQSHAELRDEIHEALERSAITGIHWIEAIFDNDVIFETESGLFTVPYTSDDTGRVTIMGIPLPVERNVTFTPTTNSEDKTMNKLIVSKLKEAGIEVEGLDDDQLLAAYNKLLQGNSSENGEDSDDEGEQSLTGVAEAVANALKPLSDKIDGLEAKMNQSSTDELDKLAGIVGNSTKYADLDVDAAKKLGVDTLKKMAANCQSAFGVNAGDPINNSENDKFSAPTTVPE